MGREKRYKTRQKSAILDFFIKNRDRHVTAYDISNHLKESGTSVGVATVYRHIDSLMSDGLLQKHILDDGRGAVYQYIGDSECAEHFHLKCDSCGELIHMECSQIRKLYVHVMRDHDFGVNSHKTVFYGKCGDCRRQIEK